ncbi:uncharacterized protein M6G45_001597 isoform 2-T6 [Spheniscus humboldti]
MDDDDEDEDEDGDGDPDAPPAPAAPFLLTSASATSASHCWPQPPPTSTGRSPSLMSSSHQNGIAFCLCPLVSSKNTTAGPISSGTDPLPQNALPAWETELQQHGSLQPNCRDAKF